MPKPSDPNGRKRRRGARLTILFALILAPSFWLVPLDGRPRERADDLPVLGRVADFSLLSQADAPVTRAAFDGEPWVANFAFTRCASVCPRITQTMRAVQRKAQEEDVGLRFVTFSVDPEHDQPEVMKSYAETYGADFSSWTFLTGTTQAIEGVARSFSVGFDDQIDPTREDLGIMHSGQLVLVDEEGRIRGYYPSTDEGVENEIVGDLKRIASR
jgi:protein SCO1/2